MKTPPDYTLPIIEKIRLLHANIYNTGLKLPKQHKLGIHKQLERLAIEVLALNIEARFKASLEKQKPLELARIKTEILKHILRTVYEFGIIKEKEYIRLVGQIVEISKMINGWIKFITEKAIPMKI